ncbi:MAG: acyl carrier protein [Colwellia sp.]|nr:acyl carrier protein [Colwellia sp.]
MNKTEIERLVIEAIQEVAPEIEQNTIDFDEDIREECDLDSMDFINYLAALQKSTGIKITEVDYPKFSTFRNALAFLKSNIQTKQN